jgi:SAM-dependent methyltransferase
MTGKSTASNTTAPSAAPPRNGVYFLAGIAFLALAKAKHVLRGYSTPKPFALAETDRCIDYDVKIGNNLLGHLRAYGGSIDNAHVLELGPGSDLGLGLYLLSKGAASYTAFDRNELAMNVPAEFYARFGERLGIPLQMDRLRYVARKDFDVAAALPPRSIDVVISNAAFEHFDDVGQTVRQLSEVVKPGGKIAAVIDLQTHSRWIREKDPNNIYRYPRWFYRLFYSPGQPNRVRPAEYRRFFEQAGWCNVNVRASTRFDSRGRSVHKSFRSCELLDACSIVLCATRGDAP